VMVASGIAALYAVARPWNPRDVNAVGIRFFLSIVKVQAAFSCPLGALVLLASDHIQETP